MVGVIKNIVHSLLIAFCLFGCTFVENKKGVNENKDKFSFIFMSDIHLQPEHRYTDIPNLPELGPHKAFSMVIDTVNELEADFVIVGGDMVYDVMRGQERSDSLFQYYKEAVKGFNKPVYNVIGNHELFGIYQESNISQDHPDYKYGMYERYLGPTYYSFDHKGWHFIVLNSLDVKDQRYIGIISEEQKSWLQDDLSKVNAKTPIVVALHIPLVSVQQQIYPRQEVGVVPNELWIYNRKDILEMFTNHNLKLVLQGHLHWLEDIYIHEKDIHFMTGGSIAGRPSWGGSRDGETPGFLLINIEGENISWNFIDYGWNKYIMKYKEEAQLHTSDIEN